MMKRLFSAVVHEHEFISFAQPRDGSQAHSKACVHSHVIGRSDIPNLVRDCQIKRPESFTITRQEFAWVNIIPWQVDPDASIIFSRFVCRISSSNGVLFQRQAWHVPMYPCLLIGSGFIMCEIWVGCYSPKTWLTTLLDMIGILDAGKPAISSHCSAISGRLSQATRIQGVPAA